MSKYKEIGQVIDAPLPEFVEYINTIPLPERIGVRQLLEKELAHIHLMQVDITAKPPIFGSWDDVGKLISLYVIDKTISERIAFIVSACEPSLNFL